MAIKASLKKSVKTPAPQVVDVESHVVDETSATDLAADLESQVAGASEGEAAATTAVARRAPSQVQRYQPEAGSGFGGDWGVIPLKFPQVKVVQGSGKLSKEFNIGTIIYNDVELFAPVNRAKKETPHVLRFVPMQIDLQFREKLSQEEIAEGAMPQIVNSVAEVEEAGGTTRWYGDTQPDNYWEPSGRCLFLLEKPENSDHPSFALDLDGKQYGVAIYYAAGGAFRACPKLIHETSKTSLFVPVLGPDGKPVFNGKAPLKKMLLWKCFWTISWDMVTAGNFTPYRPTCRLLKEETGPEVRQYVNHIVNSEEAQAAAAASDES